MISNGRVVKARQPAEAAEKLCAKLSHGMHAAAQPLTILLAGLSKANTDRMSTAELRELAESSEAQVQRVCALFHSLQQLLLAENTRADVRPTPVLPLLAHVVDGIDLLFREAGVSLCRSLPAGCDPVLIDRARTIQSLTSVLLLAHAVSRPQDTVELMLTSTPDTVQIVVRNLRSLARELDPEASLSMDVAESNMRSQQAGLCWSLQPFQVQIELPKE